MSFIKWLENKKAEKQSTKDIIVNFFRDKLKIKDEEKILNLNTARDIEDDVSDDLITRGIIKDNEEIKERIKNGISVKKLIELLSE